MSYTRLNLTDRVAANPGRVQLAPVSGQANTYDMTMADNPAQEGSKVTAGAFKHIEDGISALDDAQYTNPQTLINTSPAFLTGTSDTNPNPINFRDGSVLEIAAQGATFNQLVKNGDFVNGTTGWNAYNSSDFTVINNEASFTPTAQFGGIYSPMFQISSGHRYFICACICGDSGARLVITDSKTYTYEFSHSATVGYENVCGFMDATADIAVNDICVRSSAASGWTQIKVMGGKKGAMCIDMGTADSPTFNYTKQQMLNLISTYFEGETPVTNSTWVSTGENLINIPNGDTSCFNTIVIGNGNTLTSDSGYFKYANSSGTKGDVESTYVTAHVLPGITYNCKLTYKTDGKCVALSLFALIETNNSGNFYDRYYSENFNNSITDSITNLQFTAPAGATRMIVRVDNYGAAGTLWFKNIMVSSDLSADYEPYKSTQLTVNASFGSGDTLAIKDGYPYKNGFPVPFTGTPLKAHQGGQISVSSVSGVLPLSMEYTYTNKMIQPVKVPNIGGLIYNYQHGGYL